MTLLLWLEHQPNILKYIYHAHTQGAGLIHVHPSLLSLCAACGCESKCLSMCVNLHGVFTLCARVGRRKHQACKCVCVCVCVLRLVACVHESLNIGLWMCVRESFLFSTVLSREPPVLLIPSAPISITEDISSPPPQSFPAPSLLPVDVFRVLSLPPASVSPLDGPNGSKRRRKTERGKAREMQMAWVGWVLHGI